MQTRYKCGDVFPVHQGGKNGMLLTSVVISLLAGRVHSVPVIGILSHENNRGLRDAIRQTWAKSRVCDVWFLIDAPTQPTNNEVAQFNDIVFLESPYRGRAVRFGDKLYRWFHYAVRAFPNAPWIGKSDDDVFADLDAVSAFIGPHLSPTLYAGWLHGKKAMAPTELNRIDEAFVVVGMALVKRLVRRSYCVDNTQCGTTGLRDTNYGGTSLGLWLSVYDDVITLPLNQHMVLTKMRGVVIDPSVMYVVNSIKTGGAIRRLARIYATHGSKGKLARHPTDHGICTFPQPLYNENKRYTTFKRMGLVKRKELIRIMDNLHQFSDFNKDTMFMYLDSGVALGLYREGTLKEDGDVDVRYGFAVNTFLKLPDTKNAVGLTISMNNVAKWGDFANPKVGPGPRSLSAAKITAINSMLCTIHRDNLTFKMHRDQKETLRRTYGPLWFVRLPFKSAAPDMIAPSKAGWAQTMAVLNRMDIDKNQRITVTELDQYTVNDGINKKAYADQISAIERCKAAAFATWMFQFTRKPYKISSTQWKRDGTPFFENWFANECNN